MDIESAFEELDRFINRQHLTVRLSVNKRFIDYASPKNRAIIEKDNNELYQKLYELDHKGQTITKAS